MRRLLVLVSLLVVFFGSATVAIAQARQIVSIADNAVLSAPGATIDFPALDVLRFSEVSLLGKTTGIGVNISVKFSTVAGVFGDSIPTAGFGFGCFLDPTAGFSCGTSNPGPLKVQGPFMLIRAVYPPGCPVPPCSSQTFTLDAFLVK